MKVAAYQTPLHATASMHVRELIRERIDWCESEGVDILCCPEAVLGGLADYASRPADVAIHVEGGELHTVLTPLASETVTTILGFTEIDGRGRLYNSAAVFHRGGVAGVYRKLYPAINRSVYDTGDKVPVFMVDGLTFGIIICRDSAFREPAAAMAAQGATALFVPTNTGLPHAKAGSEIVDEARECDLARAMENNVWVIRADVAGRHEGLVAYGSSAIVDPDGRVLQTAQLLSDDLIVAELAQISQVETRKADLSDADGMAIAHRESIRSIGPRFYPPNIVDDWQEGLTGDVYRHAMARGEVFFIATGSINGEPAVLGFSSDHPISGTTHGTSVYVRSVAARRGIGSTLLRAAEAHAVEHGAATIRIEASLAGVEFYKANGYVEVDRGETHLMSGRPIACAFMHKALR